MLLHGKSSSGEPGWHDLWTHLSNQSSSSHAAQRLSTFGHRCVEEPSGQLWRYATWLRVHEESKLTRRKPLLQQQVGSRVLRKASHDEIHGGAARRAHVQTLKKKILVLDVNFSTRAKNVSEAAASLVPSGGGNQAGRCPPHLQTRLPGVISVSQRSGDPIAKERSTACLEPDSRASRTATCRRQWRPLVRGLGARGSAMPESKSLVQKDPQAKLMVVSGRRSDQLHKRRILCGTDKHCVQPRAPTSKRSGSLLRLPRGLSQAQSSYLFPCPFPFLRRVASLPCPTRPAGRHCF